VRRRAEGGTVSKIERNVVIDRPIGELFEFVHDPTNDAKWQTTVTESHVLTEGPLRVGSQIREVRRFLGVRVELGFELTEYEPPTRSSVKSISGPFPFSGSYVLEPLDGATRFTVTGDIEAHGFFKLAEPVFARMAGRELETNLGHLKDLLETDQAPSGD
jgi:uncharacterized membrane protein